MRLREKTKCAAKTNRANDLRCHMTGLQTEIDNGERATCARAVRRWCAPRRGCDLRVQVENNVAFFSSLKLPFSLCALNLKTTILFLLFNVSSTSELHLLPAGRWYHRGLIFLFARLHALEYPLYLEHDIISDRTIQVGYYVRC
jgi:hypothetical protein